ncbi:hypothetical protein ACMFMG_007862 [Clarireedia jacksonii]
MHFSKLLMAAMVGAASAAPAPILDGVGNVVTGVTGSLGLSGSTAGSTTGVSGSASGTAVVTYMDGPTVIKNINAIADLSATAKTTIENLNIGALTIVLSPSTITTVANQFIGITALVQSDITAMATSPIATLALDVQLQVCSTFKTFVKIHQDLLSVVIGKSGLLVSLGGGPIAVALRGLEAVVDTIALGLINAVPGCAGTDTDVKADAAALDVTINAAICAYTPAGPAQDILSSVASTVKSTAGVDLTAINICPVLLSVFGKFSLS